MTELLIYFHPRSRARQKEIVEILNEESHGWEEREGGQAILRDGVFSIPPTWDPQGFITRLVPYCTTVCLWDGKWDTENVPRGGTMVCLTIQYSVRAIIPAVKALRRVMGPTFGLKRARDALVVHGHLWVPQLAVEALLEELTPHCDAVFINENALVPGSSPRSPTERVKTLLDLLQKKPMEGPTLDAALTLLETIVGTGSSVIPSE